MLIFGRIKNFWSTFDKIIDFKSRPIFLEYHRFIVDSKQFSHDGRLFKFKISDRSLKAVLKPKHKIKLKIVSWFNKGENLKFM